MNFKKAVIGILAAVMMSSFVNLAQAASFTIRAQEGPFALQEEVGYDENHQNYNAFIWLKRSMAQKAVAEYVTPYFQKKGIVLSSEQADAKITETPNNEHPDCLVTTASKGELLHTMTPSSDGHAQGYVDVIAADGEQGYINSSAVKWNF